MKNKMVWIWKYWKEEKGNLLFLIFITLLSSAASVSYPLVFRHMINVLQENVEKNLGVKDEVYKIVFMLILIGLARSIAAMYPFFRGRMNLKFEIIIRNKYFKKLIRKSQNFFLKHSTGDLLTRLTDDLYDWRSITWFMCSGIFRAFDSISKFCVCIVVMMIMSPHLTLLTVLPLPIMLYIFTKFEDRIKNAWQKNKNEISSSNSILENVFSGIKIIKAYNAENVQVMKLKEKLEKRVLLESENIRLWMIIDSGYLLLGNIGQVIVIFVGGYFVINNRITLGDFYAFYVYLGMLLWPMMDIPHLLVNGKMAFVNIDRLDDINDSNSSEDLDEIDFNKKLKIKKITNITLENVFYEYEKSNFKLDNLSINVEKGESLAICGKIGSGKTTFLKLLLGLVKPSSGNVYINKINLNDIDLFSYWSLIGYVPQEPILFADTIRENILLSREEKLPLKKLSDFVNMEKEIDNFEKGFETVLTHRGGGISGGQIQRLAISRALASDPDLLILDDSTSALDAENELVLWDRLQPSLTNKISIVVTHRPVTSSKMKRVLWMKDGNIVKDNVRV